MLATDIMVLLIRADGNSPVGIPSSLLPLPNPLMTSPRQKYGRLFMASSQITTGFSSIDADTE